MMIPSQRGIVVRRSSNINNNDNNDDDIKKQEEGHLADDNVIPDNDKREYDDNLSSWLRSTPTSSDVV